MTTAPLLQVVGVSKRFGPTIALRDVDLEVHPGEVLALIGENGAGKSTLLKILSGAHPPDSGQLFLDGQPYAPKGPHDARLRGVAMIYQELNLAPDLTVEDNLMLGQPGTGGGTLVRRRQRGRVREVLQAVGLGDLDPGAVAGEQSIATQQLIEIARALISESRLILFDEPTSSLPQKDVRRLFGIIRQLQNRGMGIVYISHFLEEVREVAQRFAVLRDGEKVGQGELADVSDAEIITMMAGRDVEELYPVVPHRPGEPRVQVVGLTAEPQPQGVELELRRGEIFGVAGLVGAGRTELLRCIFGLQSVVQGEILVDGRAVGRGVRAAMRAGMGFLSEDRKGEGLAQDLSIIENITLSNLGPYVRFGVIRLQRRNAAAEQWMRRVNVKARNGFQRVSELSGGNQQKVAFARILHQRAEILLLDEPTKGIDVGTKAEIYRMMGQLAAEGKTVVFVSSYLPELLAVCDRIAVMARGRIREVRPADQWTEDEVMQCAILQ
ncbi:MAG: sugar ABC transporter ATP-binding protein [Planctomycetota bacterium]|nr:MAG: sugar ABC transporter ATP-binding protein [Planctomycetota bacterium]